MAEAQQELFKPAQLLSLLSRRRWLIIAPFCLAMLAGIVLAVKLPKMYEASTLILIEPQRVPANYVQPVVSGDLEERISTLSQQIMSRTNLEKIISDFNLYSGPEAANMFAEDKINDLRKRISVEVTHGRRETDAFTLSFRGEKPEIVAQVVNALASYFIDENLRNRESQAIGTSDFLEAEVETMRKRLETKEIALKDFRKAHMGELPEQLDSNLRILERLQEQLTSREQSLRDAKNRLVGINQLIEEQPSAVAALTPAAPGQQRQTLEDINDPAILKQQLAILKGRYTDQHPDIIRLKKRIADLEADQKHADKSPAGEEPTPAGISPAVIRQQSDIRVEIRSIEAEIADLHGQIENYRKRVESTPKVEQELLSLQRGYQDIQTAYSSLLNRKLEAEIAVNMERKQKGEQFRVLDQAQVPQRPVSPDMRKLFLLVLAGGLGLGGGLAFALEYMDSSFRRTTDVEKVLQLPVLGKISPILHVRDRLLQRLNMSLTVVCVLVSFALLLGFAAVTLMGVESTMHLVKAVAAS